jgi:hypothetical protein
MPGGIVTSLEILDTNQGMGNRGSKSDSLISVKEQRVDGYSVLKKKNTVRCILGARETWFLYNELNMLILFLNLYKDFILKFLILILKDLYFLVKQCLLILIMILLMV